jgi:hypothetical protein
MSEFAISCSGSRLANLPQSEISAAPDHFVGYAAPGMPGIMAVRWTIFL